MRDQERLRAQTAAGGGGSDAAVQTYGDRCIAVPRTAASLLDASRCSWGFPAASCTCASGCWWRLGRAVTRVLSADYAQLRRKWYSTFSGRTTIGGYATVEPGHHRNLFLAQLDEGMPGVSKRVGQRFAEASAVCLTHHMHASGVELHVHGFVQTSFHVRWDHEIGEQQRNAWDDHQEATEAGATGLAFLLVLALTDYTVIRRARKGTGFDYWLGYQNTELPFQDAARLEVSGILIGDKSQIRARVRQKVKQTEPTDGSLPAYIVVVEFSRPEAHVVQK